MRMTEVLMEVPKYTTQALDSILNDDRCSCDVKRKAKDMMEGLKSGDRICHLRKALYGLRQAGRRWGIRLNDALAEYGAKPTAADPCVYRIGEGENETIVAVYVDDILVASKSPKSIQKLTKYLSEKFDISDLGEVKCYLGIEFSKHEGGIALNQRGYIRDLLRRFGMSDVNPVSTPLEVNVKLDLETCPGREEYPYRELLGSLMYLAVTTRPDIAYAVSTLSQYLTCYGDAHWTAAKRVLRYLKKTINLGLVFSRSLDGLTGFVDSDWAGCHVDRRSQTGFCFRLSGCVVSWESRKQRTVALSSTEAEYMALTEAAKEAVFLGNFLEEIGQGESTDVILHIDNIGAQRLAENPVFHGRTKHIDVRHHFVREVFGDGKIRLEHVSTEDMAADIFTKSLPRPKHVKCVDLLGLREIK